jgi:hypothetical protein
MKHYFDDGVSCGAGRECGVSSKEEGAAAAAETPPPRQQRAVLRGATVMRRSLMTICFAVLAVSAALAQ